LATGLSFSSIGLARGYFAEMDCEAAVNLFLMVSFIYNTLTHDFTVWIGKSKPVYKKKQLIPQGHKFRTSSQVAQLSFIPQGHKFRTSSQVAQLSFIPQGHKFRTSSQVAQLSFHGNCVAMNRGADQHRDYSESG
jgi:hypothetical protein